MNEQQTVPLPFFGAQTENVNYANLCVLGISWDRSSTYRTGAHKSPDVIRYATSGELFNPYTENGKNIQDHWQIFDIGNALVNEAKKR
jgi:arginase family enzyme